MVDTRSNNIRQLRNRTITLDGPSSELPLKRYKASATASGSSERASQPLNAVAGPSSAVTATVKPRSTKPSNPRKRPAKSSRQRAADAAAANEPQHSSHSHQTSQAEAIRPTRLRARTPRETARSLKRKHDDLGEDTETARSLKRMRDDLGEDTRGETSQSGSKARQARTPQETTRSLKRKHDDLGEDTETTRSLRRKHDDLNENTRGETSQSGSKARQAHTPQETTRSLKRKHDDLGEENRAETSRSNAKRRARNPQETTRSLEHDDSDEDIRGETSQSGSKAKELLIEDLRAQLAALSKKVQTRAGEIEALKRVREEKAANLRQWEERLLEREHEMVAKEQKVQQWEDELDEREIAVVTGEDTEIARAEQIVKFLEDKLTCALCWDIIAHPYQLRPSQCGHTFCASCLLEWALSQMHSSCGHWHERLECPLCRAPLPETPYEHPRDPFSCPFIPNRLITDVLGSLIDELSSLLASTEVDAEAAGPSSRKENPAKKQRVIHDEDPSVTAWRSGGEAKASWKRRDTIGRQYMTTFVDNWSTFSQREFVKFKNKFEQEMAFSEPYITL
ncbi:hypothetical protein EIP86_004629 [Pleurotus ostreatoroseus]|nr:hypothetical protein EIP86_004629 [Pleurotus ostreatoroseus]